MSSDYEIDLRDELYDSSLSEDIYERVKESLPTVTASRNTQYTVARDEVTGIFKGTMDIKLPTVCVSVYKANRDDIKYALNRAVCEVVEEIVNKAMEE
jgi:hypothetical protein|tara:strand:+ start:532 stop:825 length:294 start_codon:yes stop_codon:yes gene_type:complete